MLEQDFKERKGQSLPFTDFESKTLSKNEDDESFFFGNVRSLIVRIEIFFQL